MHQMHFTATKTRCHNTASRGGTNPTVTTFARKDSCSGNQDDWFVLLLLMFDMCTSCLVRDGR
jgi:hypothetical protein